jgi:hypothetical protein
MVKKIFGFLVLLLFFVSLSYSGNPEGNKKDGKNQINKTMEDGLFSTIAVNSCEMWFSNNGVGSYNPKTLGAGMYFPKGSSKTAIFEDGPVLTGLVGGNVRMIGSTYKTALQAGPSIPNVDPTNPQYKIYQVRKDWLTLADGVAQTSGPGLTKADYQSNYDNWPISQGAPYTLDDNGNKIPKFIGDEQAWFVMNDLNKGNCNAFYASQPVGEEWQCLIWGYNLAGPLGNVVFKKYTIINKGSNDLEQAYLSYWADVDVGDGGDDLSGCDTTLSLGYAYNGAAVDGVYGSTPPAVGYDYLQGPMVKSANPSDIAIWNFGQRPGYRNLPMTAFTFFANSNSGLGTDYYDPDFTVQGSNEFYNLQKGLKKSGQDWINPQTNLPSKFQFPGDPVKGTGWLDNYGNRDVRITLSSGPFTLARGDTQELVVGIIIGQGADRLSSITVLKNYDLKAQSAYDVNFQLPSPPQLPKVTVAELSNMINLYWGDIATYTKTESHSVGGYVFEGYCVYQLPTASATKAEAKRIGTFDIANDIKIIFDKQIDQTAGVEVSVPVIIGSDNGLVHQFTIDKDYLRDRSLVNGQKYYFAVTSYAYNPDPDAVPSVLENPLSIITVIPQGEKMGVTYNTAVGNTVAVTKTGNSDGVVTVSVVDPTKVTGHNYEVAFDTAGSWVDADKAWEVQNYWKVTDKVTGKEVVRSFSQAMDAAPPTIDGLMIKVTGPTLTGIRRDDDPVQPGFWFMNDPTGNTTYGSGIRFFNPQNWTDLGLQAYGTGYNNYWLSWGWPGHPNVSLFKGSTIQSDQLKKVEIWFNSDKTKWQKAYRYCRAANAAAADPAYVPFILDKTKNYGYQDYVDVPFQVWNVDVTPPVQLSAGFLENNQTFPSGEVNGKWKPTTDANTTGNTGGREFIFIFASPYTTTPQTKYTKEPDGSTFEVLNSAHDMMYFGLLARRTATRVFPNDSGATGIDVKVQIIPYYPNSKSVKFGFTAPAASSYTTQKAKDDIQKITVFPNPYYGFQSMETNRYNRYVTFSHLPRKVKIKIYTLSGDLVRIIDKEDDTQYLNWDLKNHNKLFVASGMYIAYIDMPEIGEKKIVKVAIIMESQVLDRM